jgi:putative hydrolase of the HAD superfamily
MRKIEAVLFDYGMVLSGPPDAAARRRMESVLGVGPEALQEAYWKYREDYDRGRLSGESYWLAVAAELKRPMDEATMSELLEADTALWGQPNGEMIAWAVALQRAGVKTGILSNIGDRMEDGIRARFAWLSGFAHCTFSHRTGMAKPDAAIYRLAAQGLATPTEAILFVDDREENVAAAQAVGMLSICYAAHDAFVTEMRQAGLGDLPMP